MSFHLNKKASRVVTLIATSFMLMPGVALGAPTTPDPVTASELKDASHLQTKPVLLAKGKRKGKNSRGGNERIMTREKVLKSKDSTNLDFEAADISGAQKTPLGTVITQNKSDKDYDFVRLRRRWTPEMVNSAKSLDVNQGR